MQRRPPDPAFDRWLEAMGVADRMRGAGDACGLPRIAWTLTPWGVDAPEKPELIVKSDPLPEVGRGANRRRRE